MKNKQKTRKKIRKKALLILLLCGTLFIGLIIMGYLLFFMPKIIFHKNPEILKINETYTNKQFVSELKHIDWSAVKVEGKIDTNKVGSYTLQYKVGNHTYELKCDVIDVNKPEVIGQNQNVNINSKPKPASFIKEVKDETKTTVTFKKKYRFDTLGDKKITLLVRDKSNNETSVDVIAHVLPKDTTPPLITSHSFEMIQGSDIDVMSGISATDDRDGIVTVTYDSSFNKDVPKDYKITYFASDSSGNQTSKEETIRVLAPVPQTGKIIYLTIDDGPSDNTAKILDILKQYDVKATFFVTGAYPAYANFIHDAYAQGHAIGLHTYTHRYNEIYASDSAYFNDLDAIAALVKQQTGVDSHIIRFPGGVSNTVSRNYNPGIMGRISKEVERRGFQYYDWNGTSGDGERGHNVQDLVRLAQGYGNRSPLILLTHDHPGTDNASVKALPSIIEYYKNQGYSFQVLSSAVPPYHHSVNN